MTTPEEMAGKRTEGTLMVGDVVTYPRDCRAPRGARCVGVLSVYASGLWMVAPGWYASVEDLQLVEPGEGIVVSYAPFDDDSAPNASAPPKPSAKTAALTASAASVLATVADIHATYERGDHSPQEFATLGKRLVRGMARHAVLECVPAFVFEVAK